MLDARQQACQQESPHPVWQNQDCKLTSKRTPILYLYETLFYQSSKLISWFIVHRICKRATACGVPVHHIIVQIIHWLVVGLQWADNFTERHGVIGKAKSGWMAKQIWKIRNNPPANLCFANNVLSTLWTWICTKVILTTLGCTRFGWGEFLPNQKAANVDHYYIQGRV